ncbi:hypothetical protein LTS18_009275 [Coniosporium uncinatum]|uniref:Uncharacterized protein n=1 Tax=Coniosporium uncinatum TaxID=93489 RepID=A0ACC3DD28_9PEZI|nr:hypothetical protein LTS18_009275 [Coniosporium uncinatum]
MARLHITVAIVATALLLVLSGFLYQHFQELGSLGWTGLGNNNKLQSSKPSQELSGNGEYLIGVGKADITGPVVEINLMGYANTSQVGSGLRQRLYSRAFIVGSPEKPTDRFVYLVLDTQSGDTAVRHGILEALSEMGKEYAVYGNQNVAVTGTHSHSGPGAWLNYLLPQITSKGFDKQSYQAIVDGAVLSIKRAHESLTPGSLSVGTTNITNANINRSLFAYLANPQSERDRYSDNVDKTLTMLKFRRSSDGKSIGVLTWFPVHGTSMLGNNTLITGDNKGVAAYLFERAVAADHHTSANSNNAAEGFVAGFSQSNVGDTTPNVNGAYCETGESAGQPCKFEDSTCDGKSQGCHGRGPLFAQDDHGTASCFEIGRRQFEGAYTLFRSMSTDASSSIDTSTSGKPLTGPVKAFHTYLDFSNYTFTPPLSPHNKTLLRTCPAALGYSFAAGTSDGPGAFDFTQNDPGAPNASPVWGVVGGLLHSAGEEQKDCQAPKPILLDVGETHRPYEWTPNIVDIQSFRVGSLFIVVSPGEATTMAGRRWREAVAEHAADSGMLSDHYADGEGREKVEVEHAGAKEEREEAMVVLGGPANSYTHYITTPAEYAIQRYEAASTLYGPNTLDAYIHATLSHLHLLSSDTTPLQNPRQIVGPAPPINTNRSLSFINGVVFDAPGWGKSYGQVVKDGDVRSRYSVGETVRVSFVAANPRNDLRLEKTYAAVEKSVVGGWETVRTDADWDLVFRWRRTSTVVGTSEVDVSWETGRWGGGAMGMGVLEEGRYRIRYFGEAKGFGGGAITAFEGVSGEFDLRAARRDEGKGEGEGEDEDEEEGGDLLFAL